MLRELGMFALYAGGAVLAVVAFGKLYKKMFPSRPYIGSRRPQDRIDDLTKDDENDVDS